MSSRKILRNFLLVFLLVAASVFLLRSWRQQTDPRGYPVFYDFVENFYLAEVQQELALLDIGTPAARRYLLEGWWPADEKSPSGHTTFVWAIGKTSGIEFFLSEPREIRLRFRCWPFRFPGSPVQTIAIETNGERIQEVELKPRQKEYEVTLPAQATVAESNQLEFHYSYARAPEDLNKSSSDTRALAVAWDYIQFGEQQEKEPVEPHVDNVTKELVIPFGAQVDYYLKLPGRSYVTFEELRFPGASSGHLELLVQQEGKKEQVLGHFQSPEKFKSLRLPGDSPQIIRVSFRAVSLDSLPRGSQGVALIRPNIRTKAAQNIEERELSSDRHRVPTDSKRPNIIIYLIDALRADHLGCYGYDKPITPNIDAFANDALIFERAFAQAPWTRSSVASIFTGLSPLNHKVIGMEAALPEEVTTLAEILRASGYHTAAFVTNDNLGRPFGFEQGFTDFVHLYAGQKHTHHQLSDEVNEKVFAWLNEEVNHSHPFFLYIHTTDPHAPYTPPADFRHKFAEQVESAEIGTIGWLQALYEGNVYPSRTVIDRLVSLYDAEIAFNDWNFGILLKELQERNLYEDSLMILLSDHGEEFYDHGGWEHLKTLYSEMLRIPLIVRFPTALQLEGARISFPAQQIDVMPTILNLLDISSSIQQDGDSLLRLLSQDDDRRQRRSIFSHFEFRGDQGTSVIVGQWKLVRRTLSDGSRTMIELYDHKHDPAEMTDLAVENPMVAQRLLSLLEEHEKTSGHRPDAPKAKVDESLRERLKALGYVE